MDTLYAKYFTNLPAGCKIVLLGFSQGVATIMRWVIHCLPACETIVCWAGMIPEDIDYTPQLEYFKRKSIHVFYGDEDHLITPDRLPFLRKLIKESQLPNVTEHEYQGKHSLKRSVLKEWFDKYVYD